MAVSARCSLHLSPPSRSSLNASKTTIHTSLWGSEKWRSKCAMSIASSCLIIGMQMGDASAVVGEMHVTVKDHDTYMESPASIAKWSDKRMCPSWRTKAFEIIVPENLPRPSAHRRWEGIGYTAQNAPALKVAVNTNCFSM